MEWSQFFFWIPTPVILLVTAGLFLLSHALTLLARTRQPRLRALAPWLPWCLLLSWMFFGEWHLFRALRSSQTSTAPALRVLFWNPVIADHFEDDCLSQSPDLLIIVNAPSHIDWLRMRHALGDHDRPAYTVQYDRFTLLSRYPITSWGFTDLHIRGARPRSFIFRGGGYVVHDTGQALFAQLNTPLGPLTAWAIDLPSDFNLSRWIIMRQAAAALQHPDSGAFRRVDGRDEPLSTNSAPFPTPDLIVGDFNTPRGSASFQEIAPGMAHAFDHSGYGYAATYPRRTPLFAIDQAFIRPPLRARTYRIIDMGEGTHRAEVFDLERSEPSSPTLP